VISVSRLSVAPVKAMGLHHPEQVRIERTGVPQDRRFVLVTGKGEPVDGRHHGSLMTVVPVCDEGGERLSMRFPDGRVIEDEVVAEGDVLEVDTYAGPVGVRLVAGPWSSAVSELAGVPLRLARTERAGDALDEYAVSLVSLASVEELSRRGGRGEPVDAGRFRMLLELDGCRPHEEDGWLDRRVRVGDVVIRVAAHDARCAITTMSPTTGEVDFPTLKTIAAYRGSQGRQLRFGMYASVEEAGDVRVGDLVEPLDRE